LFFKIRKKELLPGQEHSIELAATLIDSDEGNLHFKIWSYTLKEFKLIWIWDYLGIATVDPEKRGCYFPGEANLTIFKVKFIVSQK
jgi:hypothetical protein